MKNHPVVSTQYLKRWVPRDTRVDDSDPTVIKTKSVAQILDRRVNKRSGRTQYLVAWQGLPEHRNTWEDATVVQYYGATLLAAALEREASQPDGETPQHPTRCHNHHESTHRIVND